ncbi:type II toxin-antitoxin system Phd/YefM family antitoxin [Treponema sp. R6D11]
MNMVMERPLVEKKTIPIHEAKSNLSRLVKRAAAGETIYIGAYGKPEAIITAVNINKIKAERRKQALGCMKGKIEFLKGWDDPLPDDVIESFYSMKGFEEFAKK